MKMKLPSAALGTLLIAFLLNHNANGQCSVLNVSPTSLSFTSSAGSKSVSVNTSPSGCYTYSYSTNAPFITLYQTSSGLSVSCSANNTGFSRSGYVNIGNMYVQVSQAAACPSQSPPGNITGNSSVCQNGTGSYQTTTVSGANYYEWSASNGTVTSGQGTISAVIQFYSSNATVSVRARNSCLNYSTYKTYSVSILSNPSPPTDITSSDPNNLCIGSNRTFSVAFTTGYTYSWVVEGTNWSLDGGQGSSSVNIRIGNGTGTIKVRRINASQCSSTEYIEYFNGVASAPISNVSGNGNICPGASTTIHLDSSDPGYTYSLLQNGISVQQKTGTSASLSFNVTPPISSPLTYTIEAQAPGGSCAVPMNGNVPIVFKPATPSQPGPVSPSGNDVCLNGTLSVSISAVDRATSYTWSAPGGTVLTGQGTTSAQIQFNSTGNPIQVSVSASNECGTSVAQTVAINVISRPAAPTDIIYNANGLCIGSNQTFQVSPITSGYSYVWEVQGSSWQLVSGQNSASAQITIGVATGTIKVKSRNSSGCESTTQYSVPVDGIATSPIYNVSGNGSICPGSSTTIHLDNSHPNFSYLLFRNGVSIDSRTGNNSSLSFSVTPPIDEASSYTIVAQDPAGSCPLPMNGTVTIEFKPAIPDTPLIISGPYKGVCNGSSASFSVQATDRATSYTWSGGTVVSGQSQMQAVITPPSSSANSTLIFVTANNECGSSAPAEWYVIQTKVTAPVFLSPVPEQCAGGEYTYRVDPKAGYSYDWTVPDGWQIIEGQGEPSTRIKTGRYDGNIQVTANKDGCTSTITSLNADIAQPQVFGLNGGGITCESGTSAISLNGSVTGVTYSLMKEESTVATVIGTGGVVNFGSYLLAGEYKAYSVTSTISGECLYPMDGVATIITKSPSTAPLSISASAYETCANSPVILSVFNGMLGNGAAWKWYAGSCGGQFIGTGASISVKPASTTTYYVRAESECNTTICASATIIATSGCADRTQLNYVRSQTVQKPSLVTLPVSPNASDVTQQFQYFDDLGRPEQGIVVQASPSGNDLLTINKYDRFGREGLTYLPATLPTTLGLPALSADATILNFYNGAHPSHPADVASTASPFSKKVFESSPLSRVIETGSPGDAWQPDLVDAYTSSDRTTKMAYETNASAEVLLWTLSNSTDPAAFGLVNATTISAPTTPIYYDPSELHKNKMKDEEGNEVIEYKNKKDQVVLKRVQATTGSVPINDSTYASTYYIFDDFGNLACVIPPQAVYLITKTTSEYFGKTDSEKESFLKRWAFRYSFDKRNRMAMKQVPGAEPIYMVYDNRDRLVLTQDGNQRSTGIKYWSFTKYDQLNRPIMTGIKDTTASLSQSDMQSRLDLHYAKAWTRLYEEYIGSQSGNVHGYSNKSYPVVTTNSTFNPNDFLTITYYDDYSFRNMLIATYPYIDENLEQTVNGITYSQPNIEKATVKGQLTGSKTKVLDGVNSWLNTVNYFDEKGRLIQSVSDNYLGGQNRTTNLYDFTGKILQTKSSHFGWKDQLHVTAIGNTLKNSTSFVNSWGTSGTASYQQLPPGEDGWIEVVVSETTTGRMIGFSQTNVNANYTSIDYALYLKSGGTAEVYEKSVFKSAMGTAPTGTILRVERIGTTVKYYLNNVLKYTSQQPSTSALLADVAFYHQNATLTGIRLSFPTTVVKRMEYDAAGRLLKTWHKVNFDPEILLSSNKYNEIGQLIDKKLHSTVSNASDAKQSVDYRYNIRGWLTSMNNSSLITNDNNDDTGDYFGFELGYDEGIGVGNTSMFNGNISGMKWSRNLGLADKKEVAYNYSYDAMNRITGASFNEKEATWELAANGAFSESNYSYDLNGNILGLTRYDERGWSAPMDKMVYDYGAGAIQSNKLLRVSETTGTNGGDKIKGFIDGSNTNEDYVYDPNGNMTKDENKSITMIAYNYLNLPLNVTKSNGNRVSYIYDAAGEKLKQEVISDSTFTETFYNGEAIYSRDINEDNVLQDWSFTTTKEGWVTNSHTSSYVWSNGSIQADVTNTDPTITSPVVSVPITSNSVIKLRMKVNAPVYSAQVFFTTTASTGISESKSIRFALVAQNDSFHEYVLDLSNNPFWTGNLQTLRIDPANPGVAGNSFAIDYVRIVSTSGVPDVALQFLNHDEGRVVMTSLQPEYQYHLKDHLGNVRLTFTTLPSQDNFTATSEAGHSQGESSDFPNYDDVTFSSITMYNHTNEAGATRSVVLNGAENKQVGLAKSIRVIPGDTINVEVYAKFYNPGSNESPGTLIATAMTSAFGLSSTSIGSEYSAYQALNGLFNTGWVLTAADWEDVNAPKAFLNYILFDENFTPYDMGWDQIDIQAAVTESTPNPEHDLLALQAVAREPGYIYVYFSNEDDEIIEVYFDDLNIQHKHGPVVRTDSYYPFGLTFNSYQREDLVDQQFLYNGKEFQNDLGLNWHDYGARMYMADIGKWSTVDPLSDKARRWTPYNYGLNNPLRFIDPDGMAAEITNGPCGDKPCPDEEPQTLEDLNPLERAFVSFLVLLDNVGGAWNESQGKKSDDFNQNMLAATDLINEAIFVTQAHSEILNAGPTDKPLADDVVRSTTAATNTELVSLEARAKEIHSMVKPATQRRTTIAVGKAVGSQGEAVSIVGSSEKRLRPAQRGALQAGEVEATGTGHAEVTVMNYAKKNGYSVSGIGASRPICQGCAAAMQSGRITAQSALKKSYVPYNLRR